MFSRQPRTPSEQSAPMQGEDGDLKSQTKVPSNKGLGARLVAGIGAMGAMLVGLTLLQLASVPLFLSVWGKQIYSEWVMLVAAAAMLGAWDLGLQMHLGSRIRHNAARGNVPDLNNVLALGTALYSVLVGTGLALVLLLIEGLDVLERLGLSGEEPRLAALGMAVGALVLLPRGFVGSVFSARGEQHWDTGLSFFASGLPVMAQMGAALAGWGMVGAAWAGAGTGFVASWGLTLYFLRSRHPDVHFGLRWPGREERRYIVRKSMTHAILGASHVGVVHLPVLLIKGLTGSGGAVIAYTTMRMFSGLVRQVTGQLGVASALEMGRQYAQKDGAGFRALMRVATRLCGGVGGLLVGLLAGGGDDIFAIWTRGNVTFSPILGGILLVGAAVAGPVEGPMTFLRVTDQAETLAWAAAIRFFLVLVLAVAAVPVLGGVGAALAVVLSEWLAMLIPTLVTICRRFDVHWLSLALPGWGAAAAGACLGWGTVMAVSTLMAPVTTVGDIVLLFVLCGLVVTPCLPFLLLSQAQQAVFWALWRGRLTNIRGIWRR